MPNRHESYIIVTITSFSNSKGNHPEVRKARPKNSLACPSYWAIESLVKKRRKALQENLLDIFLNVLSFAVADATNKLTDSVGSILRNIIPQGAVISPSELE
ncbi:MAG: hypothetical protein CMB45_06105 [Euryarchaeota archaeon]|nr:hypothetical protein [Euryarchaeota archaeon]|tara:strand:+ start:7249 stop:7554 length:306 start_codon:yes stop_codon:yes gene_type:complete